MYKTRREIKRRKRGSSRSCKVSKTSGLCVENCAGTRSTIILDFSVLKKARIAKRVFRIHHGARGGVFSYCSGQSQVDGIVSQYFVYATGEIA